MASRPKPGDRAPSFQLLDHDGEPVASSDLWADGPTVLYFYPKNETPGCTAEACSFRDQFEAFTDAGAQVVGVSADSPESHRAFRSNHRLPFRLLSDPNRTAHEAWGVGRTLGLLSGRVTFVIDREGTVRHAFSSQLFATKHVSEALEVLRKLPAA